MGDNPHPDRATNTGEQRRAERGRRHRPPQRKGQVSHLCLRMVTHMCNASHMSKETLLTTQEAANRLGVSVQTVSRWVAEGKLTPALKAPGLRGPMFFGADAVDEMGKTA